VYVKEIRLENVRGFHDARNVSLDLTRPDGSLAGWTVLAGRNGSGKTTLLRAVALAIAGPGVARNLVSDFAGWISVSERKSFAGVLLTHDPDVDGFAAVVPVPEPLWFETQWHLPGRAPVPEGVA
jgi:hypothetical protein